MITVETSAGVKSILDIPKTLEYLETQGVAVVSFGTTTFPAFYTRLSGIVSPASVDSVNEAAALIHASRQMQLLSGILIAVPIPEDDEADAKQINDAISVAVEESNAISGRVSTPFMLSRVADITKGASLAASTPHLFTFN